ncbi:MAG: hypothetical protein H7246_08310 [Phycisphaerae bacterium]|nr:hypothetical protein [Saprospiraceae bacterium]
MEVLPTANFQPDIVVAGLRLGEPMIALTSLLVALFCFYAWNRLGHTTERDDALRLSRIFFFLMGLSTLIGAVVGHLFLYCLPFVFKAPGWLLSMVAVSAFEQGSIARARPFIGAGWGRALSWVNMLELTLALCFVTATLWFPGVEIHSAFGLLCIVAPLEAWLFFKTKLPGSRYILLGILFLVGSVGIHIMKLSLSVWFCYFDLAHLMMCGAFWCFMLGAEAKKVEADIVSIG